MQSLRDPDHDAADSALVARGNSYAVHRGLETLAANHAAGAWAISLGTEYLDGYEPLDRALRETPGILVTVRHNHDAWRALAAWHTALRDLDPAPGRAHPDANGSDDPSGLTYGARLAAVRGLFNPARPLQVAPGQVAVTLSSDEKLVLAEVANRAIAWQVQLFDRAERLTGIISARRRAAMPTIEVPLTKLDEQYAWYEVRGDTLIRGVGTPPVDRLARQREKGRQALRPLTPDELDGTTVFYEDFDYFLEVWVQAAADTVQKLVTTVGVTDRPSRLQLLERMPVGDLVGDELRRRGWPPPADE
jgi:hypothetical protein